MGKHLVLYGTDLVDFPLLEVSGRLYWKKRLKFWEWKKHHTMGRPILRKRGVATWSGKP